MNWFQQGVGDAIKICHQLQCPLIVFVSDDEDSSNQTMIELEKDEVTDILNEKKFVALKIYKDSVEYQQFSQFYNVFFFPSIFCISFVGKVIVALQGFHPAATIRKKLIQAFEDTTYLSDKSSEKVARVNNTTNLTSERSLKDEDNTDRSTEHTPAVQAEWNEQIKTTLEAKINQKEDHEEHSKSQGDRDIKLLNESPGTSTFPSVVNRRPKHCRIQLRLPGGSTKVLEMEPENSVLKLRNRISEFVDGVSDEFSLVSAYPRQELTRNMDHLSLKELQLFPSGIIIVKGPVETPQPSNWMSKLFSTIIFFLYGCLSSAWNSIVQFIWPSSTSQIDGDISDLDSSKRRRIHRLFSDKDDSDKDDATDNGNSTQQQ